MSYAVAYASPPVTAARPRRLAVERTADAVTVTFPLPPRWVPWTNVVTTLVIATAKAVLLVWVALLLRHTAPVPTGNPGGWAAGWTAVLPMLWPVLLVLGGSVAFWTASGTYELWHHLRLGHVPRTLTVDRDRITLTWPGFRAVRRREWVTDRVRSVQWEPVRDVFGRGPVVRVAIRFDRGRPLRFSLGGGDAAVVKQVRQGMADLLPMSPA